MYVLSSGATLSVAEVKLQLSVREGRCPWMGLQMLQHVECVSILLQRCDGVPLACFVAFFPNSLFLVNFRRAHLRPPSRCDEVPLCRWVCAPPTVVAKGGSQGVVRFAQGDFFHFFCEVVESSGGSGRGRCACEGTVKPCHFLWTLSSRRG